MFNQEGVGDDGRKGNCYSKAWHFSFHKIIWSWMIMSQQCYSDRQNTDEVGDTKLKENCMK